jgi:hypothetical protein
MRARVRLIEIERKERVVQESEWQDQNSLKDSCTKTDLDSQHRHSLLLLHLNPSFNPIFRNMLIHINTYSMELNLKAAKPNWILRAITTYSGKFYSHRFFRTLYRANTTVDHRGQVIDTTITNTNFTKFTVGLKAYIILIIHKNL